MIYLELLDYSKYRKILDELKKYMLDNFKDRDRLYTIYLDGDVHQVELSKLVFNMILFQFHVEKKIPWHFKDFYRKDYVVADTLSDHFNNMILTYENRGIDMSQTRRDIRMIIDELTQLCCAINERNGQTLSLLDFIKAAKDPKIKDNFHQTIEFGMSYNEIEKKFNAVGKKFLEYYKSHPEREIYQMAVSDCGMNLQQFTQLAGFVGTKPDIDGSIIPYVVSNNYLIGLKEKEDIYISAKGCRKATLLGKTNVKKSGYLSQKISLLMMDRYTDDNIDDCGTKYYIYYNIDNEEKLKSIIGRHYYLIDQSNFDLITSELKTITGKEKELIGLTIGLRSPVTCCSDQVCKTCYGKHLAEVNKGRHTGQIASYLLTEPISQKLLSAKHLLKTDSEKIDWKELSELFIQNMEKLYLYYDGSFEIRASLDEDNYDENEDSYYIINMTIKKDGKVIDYESPEPLYINPRIVNGFYDENSEELIINDEIMMNFDDYVFMYFVRNNELLKSMQDVIDLIDKSDHLGVKNYHELVNKFIELIIENKLAVKAVHLEMIASALIFKKGTYDKFDFNVPEIKEDDYVIERITSAVMKGPVAVSLAFERINEQIANPHTYSKNKKSLMDRLFL